MTSKTIAMRLFKVPVRVTRLRRQSHPQFVMLNNLTPQKNCPNKEHFIRWENLHVRTCVSRQNIAWIINRISELAYLKTQNMRKLKLITSPPRGHIWGSRELASPRHRSPCSP